MDMEKTLIEPTASPTITTPADAEEHTFSWADTLLEQEDPFFAQQAANVLGTGRLVEAKQKPEAPEHRERFKRLLNAAVKPPGSSDQT